MNYLYAFLIVAALHYVIKATASGKVTSYVAEAQALLRRGQYTDGCSTPFKTYIHRWLTHSHDLCAAHDYGSLGYITVARPGWHNNWVTWLAHMSQAAPIYWIWGTIVALVTLPWVVWRRNWQITFVSAGPFYGILFLIIAISSAIVYSTYYQ